MPRNPNWTKDELILALDLYFRIDFVQPANKDLEYAELSDLLNKLPIHPKESIQEKFRNPNGVYMKLSNFLRFDPAYSGKGLDAGSKLDEIVWNEYAQDKEKLKKIARLIRDQYSILPDRKIDQLDPDEDEEFEEGKILTKINK